MSRFVRVIMLSAMIVSCGAGCAEARHVGHGAGAAGATRTGRGVIDTACTICAGRGTELCPTCGGSGGTPDDACCACGGAGELTCEACHGTGRASELASATAAAIDDAREAVRRGAGASVRRSSRSGRTRKQNAPRRRGAFERRGLHRAGLPFTVGRGAR